MKSKLKLFIIILILPVILGATKYAGEFLSLGFGSRTFGFGGIEASLTGPHSFYSNPAAVIFSNKSIVVSHTTVFSGNANYNGFGIVLPEKERGLSFGIIHIGISDIPNTLDALKDYGEDGLPNTGDNGEGNGFLDPGEWLDYEKVSYFSDNDYISYFGYSHRIKNNFSWGVSVKGIYRNIGDYSAYGMGTDFGIFIKSEFIDFATVLKNATTTIVSWSTGTKEIVYPSLKTGTKITTPFSWKDTKLSAGIEFDIYFEGRKIASQWNVSTVSIDNHLGLELSIKDIFFLRTGNNYGYLTAGGGFKYKSFLFDYGFMSHQELGSTHRFSLIYNL